MIVMRYGMIVRWMSCCNAEETLVHFLVCNSLVLKDTEIVDGFE